MLLLENGRARYCGPLQPALLREYFAVPEPKPQSAQARAVAAMASTSGRPTPHRPRRLSRAGALWFRFVHADVHLNYRPVLRDLNWTVLAGECWIVRGANGAGKSSLLRTIYGDHAVAFGGSIQRRGIVPGVPLSQFKQRCGLVAPHLQSDYPRDARALEVVVSGLHASIGLNEAATASERNQARRALQRCGALALAQLPLAELSYGQVRRVLFARALVGGPKLLLLDEAFAGLDAATRQELLALVDTLLSRGGAVVLATHLQDEIPRLASHELRLFAGRAETRQLLPAAPIASQ
jgi:molybdate transport system ATP-binding protein